MKKRAIAFLVLLVSTLVFVSGAVIFNPFNEVSSQVLSDACENADYVFNFVPNMLVTGQGCSEYKTIDFRNVSVDAGDYEVYATSYRGHLGQCQGQTRENFFLEINAKNSTVSLDNPFLGDCDYEVRDENMGNFSFVQGINTIIMHTNTTCLPGQIDSANSVEVSRICLFKISEPYCGDGILDKGEECDDGNNVDGDGCDADCKSEDIFDFCEQFYCSPLCYEADWNNNEKDKKYPADCTIVIIAKEGAYYPKCVPTTCAD